MSTVRRDPLTFPRQFFDEMNRLLKAADRGWVPAHDEESNVATSQWMPAVDIREQSERFVIEADLPGVPPEAIEVTMDNGILSIKGERQAPADPQSEAYRRIERVSGSFHRRFSLPESADGEGITAASKHGLLEIVIPKKQATGTRRISVQT